MKKIICLVLVVLMTVSIAAISVSAADSYDLSSSTPSVAQAIKAYGGTIPTYRYYLQVPNGENGPVGTEGDFAGKKVPTWLNKYSDADGDGVLDYGPAIYWWDIPDSPNPDAWVGYRVEVGDAPGIYYADVPVAVTSIIWNNGINAGMDTTTDKFKANGQSGNIGSEYYDANESFSVPEGTDNFDNMICILNPNVASPVTDVSPVANFGANWYYYYGTGHYGSVKPEGDVTDEFIESNCTNPDHDHFMRGDADKDKRISIFDATTIQLWLANRLSADADFSEANADADADGDVTVADATTIQYYLAKLGDL